MESIQIQFWKSPFGELLLGSYNEYLCLCDWRYRRMRDSIDKRIQKGLNAAYIKGQSDITLKTIDQLSEYFNKQRRSFDIPLMFFGTEFQKSVWNQLLNIPFGETETYLGLSNILGNRDAVRAVASANGANAISIIVPCHRIIGSKGELVGYAGGKAVKQSLLKLESFGKEGYQTELF